MCNRSPTYTRFSKGSTPLRRGSTKGVASMDIRHVRGAISDQRCKRVPVYGQDPALSPVFEGGHLGSEPKGSHKRGQRCAIEL